MNVDTRSMRSCAKSTQINTKANQINDSSMKSISKSTDIIIISIKIDAETMLRELPQLFTDIDLQDFKKVLERQGIDLVVEKIETDQVLLDILDFHVDFGQGYLFGEPKTLTAR